MELSNFIRVGDRGLGALSVMVLIRSRPLKRQLTRGDSVPAHPPRVRPLGSFLLLLPLACPAASPARAAEPEPGRPDPINIATFGAARRVERSTSKVIESLPPSGPAGSTWEIAPGIALQYEWAEPRSVREVCLRFAGEAPTAAQIALEWWRRIWPDNGSGGWMKLDDPYNGQWTAAKLACTREEGQVRLHFMPLSQAEAPGVQRQGAEHRRTYKIRLSFSTSVTIEEVQVLTDAVQRKARLHFDWSEKPAAPIERYAVETSGAAASAAAAKGESRPAPRFEARNGRILSVSPTGPAAGVVEVEYADSPDRLSPDRGIVVCRRGELDSFSVFVDDVLREGGLLVRDLNIFVGDADRGVTRSTWRGPTGEVWSEGSVRKRVARMPEQSLEAVRNAIPEKPRNHILLGVPDLRQEIAVGPEGEIQLFAESLRSPGSDLARRPWTWPDLTLRIETEEMAHGKATPRRDVRRGLEEGWLPIVRCEWKSGDVEYVESCLATTLLGEITGLRTTTGTEPLVLVARIEMRNLAAKPRVATFSLSWNHAAPVRIDRTGVLILETPTDGVKRSSLTPVRGRLEIFGKGELGAAEPPGGKVDMEDSADTGHFARAVSYRIPLEPGGLHAVELAVPYLELLDEAELAALRSISFDHARAAVVPFWKERVSQGMTYEVPEPWLNDLFRANLWHVLISTDLDPATGRAQHGAATLHYKNYLNETAMVAESLEMRGEHREAARLLEPFLACQGAKGLPGNFAAKEGILYAAHPAEPDPYTAQGYNMHHGWGLLQVARHFFWTKDTGYLRRIADKLVLGCDWITRERQATRALSPDGARPVEYGLAPAGDLEDVEEYLYFYATNAYYYAGMKSAARALEIARHPEASRIAHDAQDYLHDIRESLAESVATSPVIRLRDGSYIPYVPQRTHAMTHLKEGWIREALYSALHLAHCEVYDDRHPYVDWMADDIEDNIFMSRESGYGLTSAAADFFHLGGFTLQPNLVDLPLVYLRRDEIAGFLRAFYNTAWASLYPDAVCFAEWVPSFGSGGGPLYKTPDECKFVQWMRYLLILERHGGLELGLGVPRAWMTDGKRTRVTRAATLFGSMDLEIRSLAARDEIQATVALRRGDTPRRVALRLRFPEPRPIRIAEVNGKPAEVDPARQIIELPVDATTRGASLWSVRARF